ncbi:MAG: hypothetical protein ACETWR_20795 [Anaerolineae bacterium]
MPITSASAKRLAPSCAPWPSSVKPSYLSEDIVATRRYKGKTNELLTKFLLNVALFSSAFGDQPPSRLAVLDPLCGGGTTLFQALVYRFDAWGIHRAKRDIESTEAFLRGYLREMDIPFEHRAERLRQVRRRYTFRIGQGGRPDNASWPMPIQL